MDRSRVSECMDGWQDNDAGHVNERPTRPRTPPGVGSRGRGGALLIATRMKRKGEKGKNEK